MQGDKKNDKKNYRETGEQPLWERIGPIRKAIHTLLLYVYNWLAFGASLGYIDLALMAFLVERGYSLHQASNLIKRLGYFFFEVIKALFGGT